MEKGFNKANFYEGLRWGLKTLTSKEIENRACVFLSHKREDKPACREVAEYLKEAEIDYYLDELDADLQQAAAANDPAGITSSIKAGIKASTHMMVVVSEKTYTSQWVPFEIGYGHASILDNGLKKDEQLDPLKLSILILKDLSESTLPDYLHLAHLIRGSDSLNKYISQISNRLEKSMVSENLIIPTSKLNHPLDRVLNWKL